MGGPRNGRPTRCWEFLFLNECHWWPPLSEFAHVFKDFGCFTLKCGSICGKYHYVVTSVIRVFSNEMSWLNFIELWGDEVPCNQPVKYKCDHSKFEFQTARKRKLSPKIEIKIRLYHATPPPQVQAQVQTGLTVLAGLQEKTRGAISKPVPPRRFSKVNTHGRRSCSEILDRAMSSWERFGALPRGYLGIWGGSKEKPAKTS